MPLAAIIAGGQSRRMGGGDKAIRPLQQRMMIAHVIERIAPQSASIVINSNRSPDSYRAFGLPIIADSMEGFLGPLAGVLSVLESFEDELVVTVPCDTPLIPGDLVVRLLTELQQRDSDLCTVGVDGDLHPVFMLLKRELAPSIREFLEAGRRCVGDWLRQQNYCVADFSDQAGAFANINRPDQFTAINGVLNQNG